MMLGCRQEGVGSMTLESRTNRNKYVGNGSTAVFNFTFKIWKKDQIKVFVGNGETETDMTQYVAVEITSTGGTVTFSSAPASGQIIVIRRDMPYTQEDNYRNGTRFDAEEIEDRLDQDCAERQDLLLGIDRCIKLPETAEGGADLVAMLMQARQDVFWALQQAGDVTGATLVTAQGSTVARALQRRFADVVNVKDFGAKGDGITDDTEAIQDALDFCGNSNVAWFPPGTYIVTSLTAQCSIMGTGMYNTKVVGTGDSGDVFYLDGATSKEVCDIHIVAGDGQTALRCRGTRWYNLHDFIITLNGDGFGLFAQPDDNSNAATRFIVASNFMVYGKGQPYETVGVNIKNAYDCRLDQCEVMTCKRGICYDQGSGMQYLSNCHIYCGDHSKSNALWYNGTFCIDIRTSGTFLFNNIYLDTAVTAIKAGANNCPRVFINNFYYYNDGHHAPGVNSQFLVHFTTAFQSARVVINGGEIGKIGTELVDLMNHDDIALNNVSFNNVYFVFPSDFSGDFATFSELLPKSSYFKVNKYNIRVIGSGYTPVAFIRIRDTNEYVEIAFSEITESGRIIAVYNNTYGIQVYNLYVHSLQRIYYDYDSTARIATVYLYHTVERVVSMEVLHCGVTAFAIRHDLIRIGDTKELYTPPTLDNSDALTPAIEISAIQPQT